MDIKILESKKIKKDLDAALNIYLSPIDKMTSLTNTNEIRDYILNDYKEERLIKCL